MARLGVVFALCAVAVQIVYVLGKDCEWRYFQHYEQKACFPELGDNGCPLRYRCNEITEEYRTTCLHNGVRYKTKESIRDLGPCDSCRCDMGSHGAASISCAEVDCPDWEPKNKSCYMGFIPGQCCPREMCPAGEKESQKTCYHKGVNYKIGQYIGNTEHCTSCICTEQWTDENGPGCSRVNCITGIHAEKIRSGCLPIYLEKGCCAIEMYCDDLYGLSPAISSDKDDLCYYQGQYYERGSVGYLKNDARKCVTCKCTTPPDFTCVRGTCH